jgi:MFS family permease
MATRSLRTVLPLAVITTTSMLAMDLFLPAVPTLPRGLGLSVAQGQLTIAVFLAGLASSQLVWGEALHRLGPRRCVRIGLWTLVAASFGCALAPGLEWLLMLRFTQGVAAGASTVVAPTVLRATLPDHEAVRGIAAISMIEAIVPAAAPVLGTALLVVADWRWTFALIGLVGLLALPFALRASPPAQPPSDTPVRTGYGVLLRSPRFVRLALAHALAFAALVSFVASAPQVLPGLSSLGNRAFALTQVCGVSAFILAASQAGRIGRALGTPGAVRLGALLHGLLCSALLAAWALERLSFAGVLGFWMAFCATLGLRGPPAFSDALAVPPPQMGRASALMVLTLLAAGAAVTQATALFLARWQLGAVAAGMALAAWASFALVARYPARNAAG